VFSFNHLGKLIGSGMVFPACPPLTAELWLASNEYPASSPDRAVECEWVARAAAPAPVATAAVVPATIGAPRDKLERSLDAADTPDWG
jgi:hypothetical protein